MKRVGVVSDFHVGSVFGVLPPGFRNRIGVQVNLTIPQEHLWARWLDFSKWVGRLDILVINGDGPDGQQRAQFKTESCLNLVSDQCDALTLVIRRLLDAAKPKKTYVIQGTEYHDSQAGEAVDAWAASIGAEEIAGTGIGKFSREFIDLDVEGIILNFSHGISVAGGLYRATPLDREGVWSALAGKEGKVPKAECVVRSHAHNFVHVEHGSKHIVVTPAWQLQTRYMRRHSVYRMLPDIGGLVIEVDGGARGRGFDPVRINKRLYDLPKLPITKF